jgi:hypothetical protein
MPAATPLVPPPAMRISVCTGSVHDARIVQTIPAKERNMMLHEYRSSANNIETVTIILFVKPCNQNIIKFIGNYCTKGAGCVFEKSENKKLSDL